MKTDSYHYESTVAPSNPIADVPRDGRSILHQYALLFQLIHISLALTRPYLDLISCVLGGWAR